MMKFDKNSKLFKIGLILIEYIFCLFIIEIGILSFNVNAYNKNSETNTYISYSEADSIDMTEEAVGKQKIEVLNSDSMSYYIKVNCKTQTVIIYVADENGEYTIPIKKMICSTGVSTPESGVFKISDKYEWGTLVGNVYGQYCTRITGPILFHSVPYSARNKSSLEYWEYDKLGQPASKGCVRLTVEDAKWIYDNCKSGTRVEFYEENESFETAKKELPLKISEYDEELRNWDPTDPDEKNPWIEYRKQNKGEN